MLASYCVFPISGTPQAHLLGGRDVLIPRNLLCDDILGAISIRYCETRYPVGTQVLSLGVYGSSRDFLFLYSIGEEAVGDAPQAHCHGRFLFYHWVMEMIETVVFLANNFPVAAGAAPIAGRVSCALAAPLELPVYFLPCFSGSTLGPHRTCIREF